MQTTAREVRKKAIEKGNKRKEGGKGAKEDTRGKEGKREERGKEKEATLTKGGEIKRSLEINSCNFFPIQVLVSYNIAVASPADL